MKTTTPNLPALRRIVTMLRGPLPKSIKRFNMLTWKNACGTAACACGCAASTPWFTKRGFRLKRRRLGSIGDYTVTYRGRTDMAAVSRFFQLSLEDASYLFGSMSYDTGFRSAVAKRVSDFVRKQERAAT